MSRVQRHYWRKAILQAEARRGGPPRALRAVPACEAERTLAMLSEAPQPRLGWFARFIAFLATPFKRIGISGWQETGCVAAAVARPVRDAQHSTDGFWTIDVALSSLEIAGREAPPGRFLRIEVEPETVAHEQCERTRVTQSVVLRFGGAVVIDTDGPFFEVHPDEDFTIQATVP